MEQHQFILCVWSLCTCMCTCVFVCTCACVHVCMLIENHYSKLVIGSSHLLFLQKVASLESEMSQIRSITPPASLYQGLLNTLLSTSRVSTA